MFSHDRLRNGRILLWGFLGLAGMGFWAYLMSGSDPLRGWRALLINFLFFTSVAGGLVAWSGILYASKARWAGELERLAATGTSFAIPSLAALAVLWGGSSKWAPWFGKHLHQGLWLDNTFIFARNMALLGIFWITSLWYLAARRRGRGAVAAGVLIIFFCITFSLIGFDLVMALDPHWYSSLFGGYFFISALYIAAAAWAFMAVWRSQATSRRLQDLGNLVLAFSLLTTSFMYSQLLVIWYENIPEETRFLVPRINGKEWQDVSLFLLAVVYLGPLVLFLTERAKRSRWFVGAVSLLLLAGLWIERWWLVAPTFAAAPQIGLQEISSAAGFAGVFGLCFEIMHPLIPALPPPERAENLNP